MNPHETQMWKGALVHPSRRRTYKIVVQSIQLSASADRWGMSRIPSVPRGAAASRLPTVTIGTTLTFARPDPTGPSRDRQPGAAAGRSHVPGNRCGKLAHSFDPTVEDPPRAGAVQLFSRPAIRSKPASRFARPVANESRA